MANLSVIKVGGKVVETPKLLKQFLSDFSKIKGNKILVHGGGRSATALAEQLSIETKMVNGRRITDRNMLQVVTMVYGGLVNKNIVAALQSLNINALGLSGADGNLIRADKRPIVDIDYGFVGDVKTVNSKLLHSLIQSDVVPVVAPLTHDKKGNLLNTNADTIASEVAKAMAHDFDVSLTFCFEKNGVLTNESDENSLIPIITKQSYPKLLSDGIIQGGMIPKLDNAFQALDSDVKEVIITRTDHVHDTEKGTKIIL